MKIGLHIADFTWPGGPANLAQDLRRVAVAAEDAGFTRVSVMDHVWQIGVLGPPEHEMLEAYTTLGYLAACTSRVELVSWVTAVVYREPGLLAKCVTTLDVLSQGRAWLGIGAAWNEEEARGLGLPFPPTAERFERLEEALQIFLQMCSGDEGPYHGKHYTQACNLFPGPDVARKLDVLREHCAAVGRDYDEIEKTIQFRFNPGPNGEHVDEMLTELKRFAELGIVHAQGVVADAASIRPLELMGERVIPVVAGF